MKRFLCLLLVMALLCALPTPASASQEEERSIPFHVLERAAQSIFPDTDFSPAPAKRGVEYHYGIPAPLTEGNAAVRGKNLPLYYIMVGGGDVNQIMYTFIYEGSSAIFDDPDFDAEPVVTNRAGFGQEDILHKYAFSFPTQYLNYGTYTALSFTVVNHSQIVEDTAMYTEVHVVKKEIPLDYYTLSDIITGEQVTEINLCYGEERIFALGHVPEISTQVRPMNYLSKRGSCFLFEEYYGMVCLSGNELGTGTLIFHTDTQGSSFSFRVNVCLSDEGHSYASEVIREPGRETDGTTIHRCEHCYHAYTEHPESNQKVFNKFTDLPAKEWYTPEVKEAVELGLFKGVSTEAFGPETTMTRAMLVTVLWRYAGMPAAKQDASFTDVAASQWYADAVAWAAENGIVSGVGKGRFDPDGTVTREQIAAILYRYTAQQGLDMSANADLSIFDDAAQVSTWAESSLKWAVGEGLISGSAEHGKLYAQPLEGATRAQVAAILVRAINKLFADNSYYEIELPQCEVVEKGQIGMRAWTMYEDGTLVIEQAERETGFQWDWSEHKNNVVTVKILQGVETVEYQEFKDLPSLQEVVLADSVTSIGREAFDNCHMLESVRLPEGLLTIGREAFDNCRMLESVRLPEGLLTIDVSAFESCAALKEIKLPNGLRDLGSCAFRNCTSLTEIKLPDGILFTSNTSLVSCGYSAFENCTALTTVHTGYGMGCIPDGMFQGCTALRTVEITPGILAIYENAFAGCTALTEIVLPEDLQFFYDEAFLDSSNLMSVTILNPYLSLETFYENAEGEVSPVAPFPEGCEIIAHLYSAGHAIAEHFGYAFQKLT